MQYTSTMTSKGQVTVPVAIRRRLKLHPGQPVQFTVNDNAIVLEGQSWREDLSQLHKKAAAHLRKHNIKPVTDGMLNKAINDAASAAVTERYQGRKG